MYGPLQFLKPYIIKDQNLQFLQPYLWPDKKFDTSVYQQFDAFFINSLFQTGVN